MHRQMLTKEETVNKIEVNENGIVQVRRIIRIMDNESPISQSYHRHCIFPGQDFSDEDPKVKAICAVAHTQNVIDNFIAESKCNNSV